MGLCGSKRTDAQAVDAQAKSPSTQTVGATTQSTEATSIDATLFNFHITLAKTSPDEVLGMTLARPEKSKLRVQALKETGLVITHNSNNVHTPKHQVQPGDDILVVNGVSGDSDKMLQQLRSQNIVLEVVRNLDAEKTAVEVPAKNASAEHCVTQAPEVSTLDIRREVNICTSDTAAEPAHGTTQEDTFYPIWETPAAASTAQENVQLRASQAEEVVVEPEEVHAPEPKGCNLWC